MITDADLACPFCSDCHKLRRHGKYHRWALFPDPQGDVLIPVQRFLCPETGKTLSLLPEFCIPRRQQGPAILGLFLQALLLGAASLLCALRSVRRAAPGHSVAQSLLGGFLARTTAIKGYLAFVRARAIEPPENTPAALLPLALLTAGICHGFSDTAAAYVHCGVGLHRLTGKSLA